MPTAVTTYEAAIDFVLGRINYERSQPRSAGDFELGRMRTLLELLGNPQDAIPVVHVAGTKGKGSTGTMIAAMLAASGRRVGLFTSPHVMRFEERMQVNGRSPNPAQLIDLVNRIAAAVEQLDRNTDGRRPTYFEITTALGWMYFRDERVDLVSLEVGLGGRLDATNVCRPEVTVITNISRDHMELLGDTLELIAREKAGIIKPGIPTISGVADPSAAAVVLETCRRHGSPLYRLGHEFAFSESPGDGERNVPPWGSVIDVSGPTRSWKRMPVPLAGAHQATNAALALAAIDVLGTRGWPTSEDAARRGMAAVHSPVRIEVLSARPTVIVDAAHNEASISALVETLRATFPARRRVLIFAATKGKDVAEMAQRLVAQFDTVILTQYQENPRGMPVRELHQLVQGLTDAPLHTTCDPAAAWRLAKGFAAPDDLVVATGSFFLAAEMRELVKDDLTSSAQASPAQDKNAGLD